MKISRPKTERWHNFDEGDCAKPISRKNDKLCFFKKGFWKRYDRKKFIRNLLKKVDSCNGEYHTLNNF